MITNLSAIALGATIGATLRWTLALSLNHVWTKIPIGTLAANLVGGLLIGLAYSYFDQHPHVSQEYKIFVLTGFLGSLTTYSAFSLEMHQMLSSGKHVWMALSVFLHVGGSIALTGLGFILFRMAFGK